MSRRHFFNLCVVTPVLLSAWSGTPSGEEGEPTQDRPNILVIWGDDIGIDNISVYNLGMMGYQTPNIDRLAREGALFTDVYAEQTCTAGRSAFILGQHPFRTGLLFDRRLRQCVHRAVAGARANGIGHRSAGPLTRRIDGSTTPTASGPTVRAIRDGSRYIRRRRNMTSLLHCFSCPHGGACNIAGGHWVKAASGGSSCLPRLRPGPELSRPCSPR